MSVLLSAVGLELIDTVNPLASGLSAVLSAESLEVIDGVDFVGNDGFAGAAGTKLGPETRSAGP